MDRSNGPSHHEQMLYHGATSRSRCPNKCSVCTSDLIAFMIYNDHHWKTEIVQWVHHLGIDPTTHRTMSRCSTTELHLAPIGYTNALFVFQTWLHSWCAMIATGKPRASTTYTHTHQDPIRKSMLFTNKFWVRSKCMESMPAFFTLFASV